MTWRDDKRFLASSFLLIGCLPFFLILPVDLVLTLVFGAADPDSILYTHSRLLNGYGYPSCSCFRAMGVPFNLIPAFEIVCYFFSWTLFFVIAVYAVLAAVLREKQRLFSLLRHLTLLVPFLLVVCYLIFTGVAGRDIGCGDPTGCEFGNIVYWSMSGIVAFLVVWIGERNTSKVKTKQLEDNKQAQRS